MWNNLGTACLEVVRKLHGFSEFNESAKSLHRANDALTIALELSRDQYRYVLLHVPVSFEGRRRDP